MAGAKRKPSRSKKRASASRLSTAQLAARLGVSESTVRRRRRAGVLRSSSSRSTPSIGKRATRTSNGKKKRALKKRAGRGATPRAAPSVARKTRGSRSTASPVLGKKRRRLTKPRQQRFKEALAHDTAPSGASFQIAPSPSASTPARPVRKKLRRPAKKRSKKRPVARLPRKRPSKAPLPRPAKKPKKRPGKKAPPPPSPRKKRKKKRPGKKAPPPPRKKKKRPPRPVEELPEELPPPEIRLVGIRNIKGIRARRQRGQSPVLIRDGVHYFHDELPDVPPGYMPFEEAQRRIGDAMRDFVMARTKDDRLGTGQVFHDLKESFKRGYGTSTWEDTYDWLVDAWGLEPYIFDYEGLRDT